MKMMLDIVTNECVTISDRSPVAPPVAAGAVEVYTCMPSVWCL